MTLYCIILKDLLKQLFIPKIMTFEKKNDIFSVKLQLLPTTLCVYKDPHF